MREYRVSTGLGLGLGLVVRVRGRGRGRGRSMGEYYELLRQVREYRVSTPHHTKLVIVPWRLLELYSLY